MAGPIVGSTCRRHSEHTGCRRCGPRQRAACAACPFSADYTTNTPSLSEGQTRFFPRSPGPPRGRVHIEQPLAMNMAESASLSQACVRAAQISTGTPPTTRITVICCHSCEKRQNPKRCTGRTEFLRLTAWPEVVFQGESALRQAYVSAPAPASAEPPSRQISAVQLATPYSHWQVLQPSPAGKTVPKGCKLPPK
jgi:ribosomal protein L37E